MLSLTIEGNLAADPVSRCVNSGDLVTEFRVLHTVRRRTESGEWEDGATTAVQVTCWRGLAERVAESLRTGDTVTVTGHDPHAEAWTGRDGQPRAALRLTADTVALSLRYREARSLRGPIGATAEPAS